MKTLSSRSLLRGLAFPEGLRWHQGRLWFSDMWGGVVYRMAIDGAAEKVATIDDRPSGLAFDGDGALLVVSMARRLILRVGHAESGTVLHDLGALGDSDLNEMISDSRGNLYVGDFGYDMFGGAEPQPGSLYLIRPDGMVTRQTGAFDFPNGMALIDDEQRLVVAESWGSRLLVFDRQPDGTLHNRRLFADLGDRVPDGVTADGAGGLWVACFASGECIRVVEGGEVTHVVQCCGPHPVACTIGGEGMSTLFISTYAGNLETIAQGGTAGSIEIADIGDGVAE